MSLVRDRVQSNCNIVTIILGIVGSPRGRGMGPPQVQEVLDENGRVKARNYLPNFGGMGQHNQPDPILSMMLGKTMEANTALLMKMADSGKQPTDLLLGLIPHFRDQGNAGLQLSSMMETMNKIAPGFCSSSNDNSALRYSQFLNANQYG